MPVQYTPSQSELDKIVGPTHVPGLYVVARKNGVIHGGEKAEDQAHILELQPILQQSFGNCDEVITIELDDSGNWREV